MRSSRKAQKRTKRAKLNPHHCEPIRSGTSDTSLCLLCWSLSGRSFQGALRSFFQPIKNDDPHLDFYTRYKREAAEYDTDYVKKYDEDLNTPLIFVRCSLCALVGYLTWSSGGSVLCRQRSIRHRHPFEAPARSKRSIRGPPSRNPPHSQSIRDPGQDPVVEPAFMEKRPGQIMINQKQLIVPTTILRAISKW